MFLVSGASLGLAADCGLRGHCGAERRWDRMDMVNGARHQETSHPTGLQWRSALVVQSCHDWHASYCPCSALFVWLGYLFFGSYRTVSGKVWTCPVFVWSGGWWVGWYLFDLVI